jgi:hypothetical protein
MSSKGRGAPVTEAEFYPTPAWCTRRILEALTPLVIRRATWLEPCAGDGAIVKQILEICPDAYVDGGDLRSLPSCVPNCWTVGGFETHTAKHDAVITNPPFSLAPEIVKHFLPRCDWLILLLRSSFKLVNGKPGTPERFDMRDNMPDEYKLPQRPSFLASEKCEDKACGCARKVALTEPRWEHCPGCGGEVSRSTSDSSEYSWFVWTPERGRKFGRTCVLPDTPLSERNER